MSKKTKFEKKDTDATKATFSLAEITSFSDYALMRRDRYLQKMLARPANPRQNDLGEETLNPHSVVAEVDMQPLSMRQNLARFIDIEGDGFDADYDDNSDESFIVDDRNDNMPTPHELRARDLDRKLDRARRAHSEAVEAARIAGESPPAKKQNDEAEPHQAAKAAPKSPSE